MTGETMQRIIQWCSRDCYLETETSLKIQDRDLKSLRSRLEIWQFVSFAEFFQTLWFEKSFRKTFEFLSYFLPVLVFPYLQIQQTGTWLTFKSSI